MKQCFKHCFLNNGSILSDILFCIIVERNVDMWSLFIIELSHIASGNIPDLRTEAIRAITQIIQIEVNFDFKFYYS